MAPKPKQREVPEEAKATPADVYLDAVSDEHGPEIAERERRRIEMTGAQAAKDRRRPGLDVHDRAHLIQALVQGVETRQDGVVVAQKFMDWDAAVLAVAQDIQPGALAGCRDEIMRAAQEMLRKRQSVEEHNAANAKTAAAQATIAKVRRQGFCRSGINANEQKAIVRWLRAGRTWAEAVALSVSDPIDLEALEAGHREGLEKLAKVPQ